MPSSSKNMINNAKTISEFSDMSMNITKTALTTISIPNRVRTKNNKVHLTNYSRNS